MGRLSFVAGVGIGYVLGARAGRQRYEQIKTQAGRAWRSQPVQDRVGTATEAVKQQAAPFVTEKLGDAVKAVGQSMRNQSSSGSTPGSASTSAPAATSTVTSTATPTVTSTATPSFAEQLPESIHRGADGELPADKSGHGPGADKLP